MSQTKGRQTRSTKVPPSGPLKTIYLVSIMTKHGGAALILVVVSACGSPTPPSTGTAADLPPFVVAGAFVTRTSAVSLYQIATAEAPSAQVDGGALLQVLDSVSGSRIKVLYPDLDEGSLVGWMPLGFGGVPGVEPAQLSGCPTTPNIGLLIGMSDGERLTCYRERVLTFPPVVFVPAGRPGRYEGNPPWLAEASRIGIAPAEDGEALLVHVPPELTTPEPGRWSRVAGRFDDPRSADCQREPHDPHGDRVQVSDAILWCRQQFVVVAIAPASGPELQTVPPDVDGP